MYQATNHMALDRHLILDHYLSQNRQMPLGTIILIVVMVFSLLTEILMCMILRNCFSTQSFYHS